MTVRFVETIGFGGAFALGAVQAGLKMVGKVERPDAFGAWNTLSNRHLLGYDWELQIDREGDGSGWDPIEAEVILGNPPCSGFSNLTKAEGFKGIDSPINIHMHALVGYAARVQPSIVMFESVQGAYSQGLELMRALRGRLEEVTGDKWALSHVLHNNLSLGGCALRRRYFFVASRVPFGVEKFDLKYLPTADDALHDLEPCALTWERQPYRAMPTRWSQKLRSPDGMVDGHAVQHTPNWERARQVAERLGGWPEGVQLEVLLKEHHKKFGRLPGDPAGQTPAEVGYHYIGVDGLTREQHLAERDFAMGPTQLFRWRSARHAYVITGGALTEYVHPHRLRTFTHREAARIQGFPDDWRMRPHQHDARLGAVWGKGVPVDSGRWIAYWAKRAVEGDPGSITGDEPRYAERDERVINVTNDWMRVLGDRDAVRDYYERTR